MEITLIIGGIALFVAGLVVYARWSERRRTTLLASSAEEMGLEFRAAGDANLQKSLSHFKLFNQGRARKLRNLVVGDAGDINISIFDYQYTVGGGNHQATIVQTVVLLASPDLQLPAFTLRPESMFDKLGGALGLQQDIDIEEHPEFSRMYLLKSDNEVAVRELFHKELVEKLQNDRGVCIEAVPGLVIIYNSRRRKKAGDLKRIFGEALDVYNLLTTQA